MKQEAHTKHAKFLSEYEEFARKKGLKVENCVVFFGEDVEAANNFYIAAKGAGFEVIKRVSQPGCYANEAELLKLPKIWFVRLMSESPW